MSADFGGYKQNKRNNNYQYDDNSDDSLYEDEMNGGYYVDGNGDAIDTSNSEFLSGAGDPYKGQLYGGALKPGKGDAEDREGYDSFTIHESSIDYSGSRLISKTPFAAAGKAATRLWKEIKDTRPSTKNINFVLRKTTLNSNNKFYAYVASIENLSKKPLFILSRHEDGDRLVMNKYGNVLKINDDNVIVNAEDGSPDEYNPKNPYNYKSDELEEVDYEDYIIKKVSVKITVKSAEVPENLVNLHNVKKLALKEKVIKSELKDAKENEESSSTLKVLAAKKKAIKAKLDNAKEKIPQSTPKATKAAKSPKAKAVKAKKATDDEEAEIKRITKENKAIEAEIKKARAQVKKNMINAEKKQQKHDKVKEEVKALKAENKVLAKAPKATKAAKSPKAKAPKAKKGGSGSCGMYY